MIGIELLSACCQFETALEVSRINQQLTKKGNGVAVHRVEPNGPLRRMPEALKLLPEEEYLRQAEMGQVIGWSFVYRMLRSGGSPRQGISQKLESLPIILRA